MSRDPTGEAGDAAAAAAPGPLRALVGAWEGEGHGDYPTIEPFRYRERVVFDHDGRPFLGYVQRTQRLDGSAPMHRECGFLRLTGGRAELVVAQHTGLVEILVGSWQDGALELTSEKVAAAPTAVSVDGVRRRFAVDGDVLTVDLWMAIPAVDEAHHLHAVLRRVG